MGSSTSGVTYRNKNLLCAFTTNIDFIESNSSTPLATGINEAAEVLLPNITTQNNINDIANLILENPVTNLDPNKNHIQEKLPSNDKVIEAPSDATPLKTTIDPIDISNTNKDLSTINKTALSNNIVFAPEVQTPLDTAKLIATNQSGYSLNLQDKTINDIEQIKAFTVKLQTTGVFEKMDGRMTLPVIQSNQFTDITNSPIFNTINLLVATQSDNTGKEMFSFSPQTGNGNKQHQKHKQDKKLNFLT